MGFSVSPATTTPGGSLTATGTGSRKRPARIRVSSTDPVTPNALLTSFTMPASGKFSRTIPAPSGSPRTVTLVLQQPRADGVWAQTADVPVVLLLANGSGGGTTPVPNDPPPPPPPDIVGPTFETFAIEVLGSTSARITATLDKAGTFQLQYGLTPLYGSLTTLDATLGTAKQQTITGLTPGTQYYVQGLSKNADGYLGKSSGRTFTTAQIPAPPPGTSITVNSISALLNALANNTYTEIVVADGTYAVTGAAFQAPTSLWIGSRFASRTNPVLVRPATPGGVIFDGNGANVGIAFEDGAHHQEWADFHWTDFVPTMTGVLLFAGYANKPAAHHITLTNPTLSNITSPNTTDNANDHSVYFSQAASPGLHDIVIDGLTLTSLGTNRVDSAFHFFHSESGNPNASDVIIRNATIVGTRQAFILWDSTLDNILLEDINVDQALTHAFRYENPGTNIVARRFTSTNSGGAGFFSSLGPSPSGLLFDDCNFDT